MFSGTLPRWGSMRSGVLFRLPMPADLRFEKEFGFWPTPDASAGDRFGQNPERVNPERTYTINDAVRMWPAAMAGDAEQAGSEKANMETLNRTGDKPESRRARNVTQRHTDQLNDQAGPGKQLNPDWVEMLMGWPVGWTYLPPDIVSRLRAEARTSSRGNRPARAKASNTAPKESGLSGTGKTHGR